MGLSKVIFSNVGTAQLSNREKSGVCKVMFSNEGIGK